MKHISIIIVNWNGKEDTIACLDSIKRMTTGSVKLETIVVDNGSTNDSLQVIAKHHPWVTLINAGKNLGFTGGNNLGIRDALAHGAQFVWLLNNDTVVDRNALCLIEAFDSTHTGVAGSKIYFASGHEYHKQRYKKSELGKVIWYAGGLIDWENMYASHRGVDEVDHGQYDTSEDTPFITGCSLMASKVLFDRIGLLDDRFYLYLEDLDFCLRANHAGFSIRYQPSSTVWHVNAGSSGGAGNSLHQYYMTRNRLYIGMKYAPVRTKFALMREALRFVSSDHAVKRKAVLDALFGQWGKQYDKEETAS